MKKSVLFSILFYIVIFSLLLLERVRINFPLNITLLLITSLIYSIPIVTSLFLGERYINKNPKSKKLFWKMPLYSLSPSIITTVLWYILFTIVIQPFGEEGMAYGFFPFAAVISATIFCAISIFLSTLIYSDNKIYLSLISVLAISFFIFSVFSAFSYVTKCGGLEGCTKDNLACFAKERRDPSICYLIRNSSFGSVRPVLSFSKTNGGNSDECFFILARLENNPLICEKAGYVDDWCYGDFAEMGFPIMCDKIKDPDSRSDCYYSYATILKDETLCSNVHATEHQTYDKEGCIFSILYIKKVESRIGPPEIFLSSVPEC